MSRSPAMTHNTPANKKIPTVILFFLHFISLAAETQRPRGTTQVSRSHRLGRADLHPSGAAPLGTPHYPRSSNAIQPGRGQAHLPDHETFFLESSSEFLCLCGPGPLEIKLRLGRFIAINLADSWFQSYRSMRMTRLLYISASISNVASSRSSEFGPTITLNSPGSTTKCISRFQNPSSAAVSKNSTCFLSPG